MFLLVLGMALGRPLLSLVASIVVFGSFLQFGYVAAALFKYSVGADGRLWEVRGSDRGTLAGAGACAIVRSCGNHWKNSPTEGVTSLI